MCLCEMTNVNTFAKLQKGKFLLYIFHDLNCVSCHNSDASNFIAIYIDQSEPHHRKCYEGHITLQLIPRLNTCILMRVDGIVAHCSFCPEAFHIFYFNYCICKWIVTVICSNSKNDNNLNLPYAAFQIALCNRKNQLFIARNTLAKCCHGLVLK